MGQRMIDGRRGPRRKVVDVVKVPRKLPSGRVVDREYEVLECGHARHVGISTRQQPHPVTNRRHCLECVKAELGWSNVRTAEAVREIAEAAERAIYGEGG